MAKKRHMIEYQTNFGAGEIDPTLRGQTDLKVHAAGVRLARNCQRRATGGLERRFGTYAVNSMSARARLVRWEFSASQRYVLGFVNGGLNVYRMDGVLVQAIYLMPWSTDQAFQLTVTQLGDTMIICHQQFAPMALRRIFTDAFDCRPMAWSSAINGTRVQQPHYKFAPGDVSLSPSGVTGDITLTASSPIFSAGYVGLRLRLYDAEVIVYQYVDPTHVLATVQGTLVGKLDIDPIRTQQGVTTVDVTHPLHGLPSPTTMTLSGINSTGGVPHEYLNGTWEVWVRDENHYFYAHHAGGYQVWEDLNQDGEPEGNWYIGAHHSEDGGGPNVQFDPTNAPTRSWTEPAFSSLRGWPQACAFHEGRLWFGGSAAQPDGVWGSCAMDYFNFDVGTGLDNESVQLGIGTDDLSMIRHLVSNGELLIFTSSRESVFAIRDGEPITPNNARVKSQSNAGVSRVSPVIYDGVVTFAQENGLSVNELVYSANDGGYVPVPISALAGHLIRTPVSLAASQGLPTRAEQQLFVVNSDGTVAVFFGVRRESTAGWTLWTLGQGTVQSVAAVGPYVWFCVHAHGQYWLYRYGDENLGTLDGQYALQSGVATDTWNFPNIFWGKSIGVVSDLGYHGMVPVPANGVVTLSVPVTRIAVGDPFFWHIQMLPPVVTLPNGQQTGVVQRVVRSVLLLDDCLSVTVNGEPVISRLAGDQFDAPPRAMTGAYEMRHLGYARDGHIVITQEEPLRARVLSAMQEVMV